MAGNDRGGRVARLLAELERGGDAAERIFPIVYEELRALAEVQLRRERSGHTLQPTALVHEAFLKLVGQKDAHYESRSHFLAIAATAMRRVLVHHAEKRGSAKRGGGRGRQRLDTGPEIALPESNDPVDLLALDEALVRLAALDERCGGDAARAGSRRSSSSRPAQATSWSGRRPVGRAAIDRWRVLERIGAGGMGVVYKVARDDGVFEAAARAKLLGAAPTA
jgi:RNA polymerase sigma factor (TIGR02999 family)